MDMREIMSLISEDVSDQLVPVATTAYHGSPATGITAFDPARRGSNTGDRDAKQGFFFFGTVRAAEGYLERDEDLKPEVRAKRDRIMAQAQDHKARYDAELAAALRGAGVDPASINLDSWGWHLKLPIDVRDQFRNYDYNNSDHQAYQHFKKMAYELEDRSANLINVLNGAVYTCEIRLQRAYVQDMKGAAYSAERYAEIIRHATINHDPDGLVLHNVLDSEVGLRDTVYIVFDADDIEIVDRKIYDNVETTYRSY